MHRPGCRIPHVSIHLTARMRLTPTPSQERSGNKVSIRFTARVTLTQSPNPIQEHERFNTLHCADEADTPWQIQEHRHCCVSIRFTARMRLRPPTLRIASVSRCFNPLHCADEAETPKMPYSSTGPVSIRFTARMRLRPSMSQAAWSACTGFQSASLRGRG